MLGRKPKAVPLKLNAAMSNLLDDMLELGPNDPKYPTLLSYAERVHILHPESGKQKLNINTVAIVVGNMAVTLIIVAYEQKHVMVSKALGFVLKPKN